jgi:hypothetical protein
MKLRDAIREITHGRPSMGKIVSSRVTPERKRTILASVERRNLRMLAEAAIAASPELPYDDLGPIGPSPRWNATEKLRFAIDAEDILGLLDVVDVVKKVTGAPERLEWRESPSITLSKVYRALDAALEGLENSQARTGAK